MSSLNFIEKFLTDPSIIKSTQIIDTFSDDNILCMNCLIDEESVEFWWCGWEVISCATYVSDSEKAHLDFYRYLLDWSDEQIQELSDDGEITEDYQILLSEKLDTLKKELERLDNLKSEK